MAKIEITDGGRGSLRITTDNGGVLDIPPGGVPGNPLEGVSMPIELSEKTSAGIRLLEKLMVDRPEPPSDPAPSQEKCFVCGGPGPSPFDPEMLFNLWSGHNQVVCDWRCQFDGIREKLLHACRNEPGRSAHPSCALRWAVESENLGERYPDFSFLGPPPTPRQEEPPRVQKFANSCITPAPPRPT